MSKATKILFYAINGTGLGHLNRLLVLARAARELLQCQGLTADFRFLTTSEADQLAWDFPTYKLPSKTVVGESDARGRAFAAQAKLLISNLVAGFHPDLLVMDTLPQGSYQEFIFLKDYARATAFVDRHKDMRVRRGASHGATLALYDLILAPDDAERRDQYPIPGNMEERRIFTGAIHAFAAERAYDREQVRAYFGVAPDQLLVYVSAGGGGDPLAVAQMNALVDRTAADPRRFVLAGYGPLYRGPRRYGPRIAALTEADAWRFFPGLDYALCSAGYNSWHELLAAEVPAAFFAQNKGMDRQDLRIDQGLTAGWHLRLAGAEPAEIDAVLTRLDDPATRIHLGHSLATRTKSQGALRAAVALLQLCATNEHSPIDRADLITAAATRLLPRAGHERFVEIFRQATHWMRLTQTAAERAYLADLALVLWETRQAPGLRFSDMHEAGTRLAQLRAALALPERHWHALLTAYGRECAAAAPALRLQALTADLSLLLEHYPLAEVQDLLPELLEGCVLADLPPALARLTEHFPRTLGPLVERLRSRPSRRLDLDHWTEFMARNQSPTEA